MNKSDSDNNKIEQLRKKLSDHLSSERKNSFGQLDGSMEQYLFERFWQADTQKKRVMNLKKLGILPGSRILDLAAGHGQFVEVALKEKYDCFGIEPDSWILSFAKERFAALKLPPFYAERIIAGVGESLPFDDNAFDYVVSYQTLEHVQSPDKVIAEMLRVTRQGGAIYIQCPDYRSTFEAHYYLPWLPLFPRCLAKIYLRMLGRPTAGLDTIQYITKPKIFRWLNQIEKKWGYQLIPMDLDRSAFENKLRRRGLPQLPLAFAVWRLLQWIKQLGRSEITIKLFIRVLGK